MRYYDSAEFGVLGVAVTFALLMSTALSCKLEHSIHIDANPAHLFKTCLTLILALLALLCIPLFFALQFALGASNAMLAMCFAISHAIFGVCYIYLNFLQQFRAIAVTSLTMPIVFLSGALWVGAEHTQSELGLSQLLFWQSLSVVAATIIALVLLRQHLGLVSFGVLRKQLTTHRSAISYLVPSHLLSTLSLNISVIATAYLFDQLLAGMVVVALRMSRAPVTMVGNAMNEVLRSTIPARVQLSATFKRIALCSLLISMLMLAVAWLTPESAYLWIVGEQWSGLSDVLNITVVVAAFQLIGTSVICLLTVFAKRSEFIINLLLVCAALVVFGAAYTLQLSPLQYLWAHVAVSSAIYLFAFKLSWQVMKMPERK